MSDKNGSSSIPRWALARLAEWECSMQNAEPGEVTPDDVESWAALVAFDPERNTAVVRGMYVDSIFVVRLLGHGLSEIETWHESKDNPTRWILGDFKTLGEEDLTLRLALSRLALVDDIDSSTFHARLATVQKLIGQDDGGLASAFFSGRETTWKQSDVDYRRRLLRKYIHAELTEALA